MSKARPLSEILSRKFEHIELIINHKKTLYHGNKTMQDVTIVTARQISESMLGGMKSPNRVLEDAKLDGFPEALKNISRKPLVWNKSEVHAFYFPDSA